MTLQDMSFQVDYQPYRIPFRHPIHTHHGAWIERQGLIICLKLANHTSAFGEIAPLPTFGSETLEEALEWCQSLSGSCTTELIHNIPEYLPACQFGFESALEAFKASNLFSLSSSFPSYPIGDVTAGDTSAINAIAKLDGVGHEVPHNNELNLRTLPYVYCRLLPTGKEALHAWSRFYNQGDRTFKWKIGVAPIQHEQEWFDALLKCLPLDVSLRLDANGGLNWDEANQWLKKCDRINRCTSFIRSFMRSRRSSLQPRIEFLEQPLSPNQFQELLHLSHHYQTPIALDESVATLKQLKDCYAKGWRSIVVIKAAIAGYPSKLREFCLTRSIDVVWSSVFETAIARRYILNQLIPTIPIAAVSTRRRGLKQCSTFLTPLLCPNSHDQSDKITHNSVSTEKGRVGCSVNHTPLLNESSPYFQQHRALGFGVCQWFDPSAIDFQV